MPAEANGLLYSSIASGPVLLHPFGNVTSACCSVVARAIETGRALHNSAWCSLPGQVVVGAVGHVLRVERCERLQLVAAAVRILITSCHDCVFYLGVNRPPLLLGDNRFLQVLVCMHGCWCSATFQIRSGVAMCSLAWYPTCVIHPQQAAQMLSSEVAW